MNVMVEIPLKSGKFCLESIYGWNFRQPSFLAYEDESRKLRKSN